MKLSSIFHKRLDICIVIVYNSKCYQYLFIKFMKANNLSSVLLLIIFVLFVGLISYRNGLVEQSHEPIPPKPTVIPTPTVNTISDWYESEEVANFKKTYIDSCLLESNGKTLYCNCTYDYLENKLGFDGLVDYAVDYTNKKASSRPLIEAIEFCLNSRTN